jgi:hypothetical protein
VSPADIFGERPAALGQRVSLSIPGSMSPKLEPSHPCPLGPVGLAYHAASMRVARILIAVVILAGVACTRDSTPDVSTSSTSMTPPPTVDQDVTFVPGEWTYELYGVKATFTWKAGGQPTLSVKNGSDEPVGAPDVYVVTRDQRHVDGKIADATSLDPSDSGDYEVTFPADLSPDDVGLVVMELGGVNWGALGPKIQGS